MLDPNYINIYEYTSNLYKYLFIIMCSLVVLEIMTFKKKSL